MKPPLDSARRYLARGWSPDDGHAAYQVGGGALLVGLGGLVAASELGLPSILGGAGLAVGCVAFLVAGFLRAWSAHLVCRGCGELVHHEASFCAACGVRVPDIDDEPAPPDDPTAAYLRGEIDESTLEERVEQTLAEGERR